MSKEKLAIAYAVKRRNKSSGGMINSDEGFNIRKTPQDIAKAVLEKMSLGTEVEEENLFADEEEMEEPFFEGGEVEEKAKRPALGLLSRIKSRYK